MAASAAQAQDFYGQVDVGMTTGKADLEAEFGPDSFEGDLDLDRGVMVGGLIGKTLNNGLAIEGEVLWARSGVETDEVDVVLGTPLDASISSLMAMANARYVFQGDTFSPYLGAGLGFGRVKVEMMDEDDTDTGLAWQVKAGVIIKSSDTLSWDLGYRYVDGPEYEVEDGSDSVSMGSQIHAVSLGMRYAF